MRRFLILLAALLPLLGGLTALPAEARLGGGHSFGSRGAFSFRPPRETTLAPGGAMPFERSQSPMSGYGRPSMGAGMGMGGGFNRHPFMTGLLGGLVGAGIFGMLFGGGFLHMGFGFGGFFGVLIQLFLLFLILRWLMRRFLGRGRGFAPQPAAPQPAAPQPAAPQPAAPQPAAPQPAAPLQITPSDNQAFAQCLVYVQQAWGAGDLNAISRAATPEMMGYFREQLATLSRQGLRNHVANVSVDGMEISEAWSEGETDFATVALRFSMLDVTEDQSGRVVDGSPTVRALVTEIWTFTRRRGAHWILAAIQQTR